MKKQCLIKVILIFSALLVPAAGYGDYVIHLKNGGRFLTPRYWEQAQEIKFYIAGGVMGIDRNTVRKIEKSTAETDDVYETKKPENKPAITEQEPAKAIISETIGKDQKILQEFIQLKSKYEIRGRMNTGELDDLRNGLSTFIETIVINRLNAPFKAEVTETVDMRNEIDKILKEK